MRYILLMWISTTQYRAHEESQGEKEWRAVSKLSLPPNLTNKTHKYLLLIFHVIWLQKTRDLNPNRKISLKKATHWRNWKIHLLGRTELCTKFLNLIFVFLHISLSQPKRNSSLCWSSKSCWKIKALLAKCIQKNTGLSFRPSIACTTSADEAASCWQSAKDVNYNDHPK